jgi:hypothetical protein
MGRCGIEGDGLDDQFDFRCIHMIQEKNDGASRS